MTTQPVQPEAPQPAAMVERVSRLEGITEQINLRLAENAEAISTLRADLSAKIEERGKEIARLRADMHRQTLLVVGILGGLMALLRFVG